MSNASLRYSRLARRMACTTCSTMMREHSVCSNVVLCNLQMEEIYYHNIEYIDFEYFPVLLEDYEDTSDRPACEKQPNQAHYSDQVGLAESTSMHFL